MTAALDFALFARNLVRVDAKTPCPVCRKPDWCSVDREGRFTICMRVASSRPTRNSGFLHAASIANTPTRPAPATVAAATAERRDTAYRALLERLSLSRDAARDLRRRGLSEEMVVSQLYCSIPKLSLLRPVVEEVDRIADLHGIPGFYFDGEWKLNSRESDLLIPIRNASGHVVGCQLRNACRRLPRYRWLSSAGHPEGCPASASPHFSLPYLAEWQLSAIVTEGPLKADVIADKLHRAVVGIPGASSFADDFGRSLRSSFPRLRRIAIAYDADSRQNNHVKDALRRLVLMLMAAQFTVSVLFWDMTAGKGLDDVLNAEES